MSPSKILCLIVLVLSATSVTAQDRSASTVHVFPVIVNGTQPGGPMYRTSIVMQNGSNFSSTCWVQFYGSAPAMTAPDGTVATGGLIQQFLPPGSFDVLRSSGAGSLSGGYAKINCSTPIVAYTVYSSYSTGVGEPPQLMSETSVQSSSAATTIQFVNDAREDGRLALAITNDETLPVLVRIELFDLYGRLLSVTQLALPAKATISRFLNELVAGVPVRHVGPIRLVSSHSIYATGLKFTGSVVTGVPGSLSGFIQ